MTCDHDWEPVVTLSIEEYRRRIQNRYPKFYNEVNEIIGYLVDSSGWLERNLKLITSVCLKCEEIKDGIKVWDDKIEKYITEKQQRKHKAMEIYERKMDKNP